jgi:hypothetical protein
LLPRLAFEETMTDTTIRVKDPTAAERARRYRERKRALVPVTPTVTAVTVPKPSRIEAGRAARVTLMPPADRPRFNLLAAVVLLLGLATAAIGLWLNASFLWAFGRTSEAGIVLAVIGLVTDAVTLVLPSVTAGLWQRHRYALAVTALAVYFLAVTMTVLTSLGFASTNIGDAVTGRGAAADQRAAIANDVARLGAERAALQFTPTTAEAVTAATVARDQECGRVGDNCRRRVAELAGVLQAKALTDRAATIDASIAALAAKLAGLPAVASADPQIESAVAVIAWLSRGLVTPSAADLEMVRLLGVAIIPILGGLLIAFAMGLAQPARRT